MRIRLITFTALFLCFSCARYESLNQEPHRYGVSPRRIIWLQIPGFSEDHVAMLRFNLSSADARTSFEKFSCLGKAWNYNLYQLRPSGTGGLFSQIVGKENISNTCTDFNYRPIWSYLSLLGYKIGIIEAATNDRESLDYTVKCKNKASTFLDDAIFFRMAQTNNKSRRLFHYQDKERIETKDIYYDRSCQRGTCYASLTSNITSIFDRFKVERGKYFLLIRDFSYYKALKKKNIEEARTILSELNQIIGRFLEMQASDDEMLFIVSSSAANGLDFPRAGKEWAWFERNGKFLGYKSQLLLSPVMAKGAGAENFCGVFKESDIFSRLIKGQQVKRKLPLF